MTVQLNFYAQSTAQELDQNATVLINNKKLREIKREKVGQRRKRGGEGEGEREKILRILSP